MDASKEEIKEFGKIEEIDQNEEVICTISKDSSISNQDLIAQKVRRKRLLKLRSPDWDKMIKQEDLHLPFKNSRINVMIVFILIKLLINLQNNRTVQILTKERSLFLLRSSE